MKKNGWKRLLAVALVLILALSLVPAAFATGAEEGEVPAPTGTPAPTEAPTPTEAPAPTATPTPTEEPVPTEAPAACTKTEGCTLTDGHEGDCVLAEKKPEEVPAAVQAFLDAVASIVIPEEVNEETGPVLDQQIGAAQNAYDALSEAELAREDVQAAVAKLMAAIKALTGGVETLEGTAVARIGETEFETLDAAVAAAVDGDTIELLADCGTAGFNLRKNLTINGNEKTISFTQYGIALWGTALTFNNCNVVMTGIGSTPYTAEWTWMAICASKDASLTLNSSTMSMDGTGAGNAHAIYFCNNNKLNLNSSTLRISNYAQDALEWNEGDGEYNINLTGGSHFISDHNRSGFTGTFVVNCDGSYIDVVNSTGNGSNGSHFDIKNGSEVNFNNNGAHGLSAGWCKITGSTVTASGNGANGLHTNSTLTIDGSTVTVEGNKCSISSKWTIPGAVHIGGGESSITNGSTVTIKGNSGSGIYQKAGSLKVDSSANVTIVENKAEKLGYGGGIYVNGTVEFPANLVLYNNHAGTAGDDIYNKGTISFGNVGTDWALDGEPDCNGAIHAIDGWYEDGEGSRWLADTADTSKQHVVLMNAGTHTASDDGKAVALKAAHGLIPVVPVDPVPGPDWAVSRSKTATNLDANFESRVTLSLPSAEEQLVTDIVFVLDKSTSPTLEQQTLDMLQTLKAQIENTNAQVKVGVVIFNKVANMTNFMDLATQYDAIEAAIRQEISSGTNAHAGLLAGIGMLDNDSSVDDSRKYLIFVSDGITYIYNQTPTATAWSFWADTVQTWAGPDNWKSKYGSNNPPADWAEFLGRVKTQAEVQGTTYEYPYGGTPTASTPVENQSGYVNSVDKALCLTYEAYSAAAAKYHCYAMAAGTKSGEQYLWGPSFMRFLADGRTVDFSQIQNDILYLVDRGSKVVDYMGYVADDYDFDFVKPEDMILKVGSESYAAVKLSENEYGFKPVNGGYAFTVEYLRGNGHEEEHFIWNINEPVSNFAPVQLTYMVQLTNPKEEPGTYGAYDRDGSTDATELYTNNSAVLYPVDSNGQKGEALPFPKPTVSYTVEPKKLAVTVTKVWDDFNDNDGFRPDSVTVTLLADGEPTGKTLVLSEANQWTGSFTELDAYADGEEIVYTVTENKVNKYTTVITNAQDSTTDFIITNSHVPEMMSIPVVKRWNDNNDANDRRPGSITVYLYANGVATGEKLRITARNGWVGEFENLPVYANGKAIDYSIREKSMYFYSGAVSTNPNGGFIITNTYTTSPGTGDSSNIGLWAAMAGMSLMAIGASLVIIKKKETGK